MLLEMYNFITPVISVYAKYYTLQLLEISLCFAQSMFCSTHVVHSSLFAHSNRVMGLAEITERNLSEIIIKKLILNSARIIVLVIQSLKQKLTTLLMLSKLPQSLNPSNVNLTNPIK